MDEARIRLLVGAWFDGALTAEEKAEMEAVLRSSRRARALFWEEADAHALLAEAGARQKAAAAGPPVAAARVRAGFRVPFFARRKAAVAAAAALLLGGGIVALRLVPPAATARPRAAAALHPAAPVRLIRQTGMQGLELPAVLPGRVRLRQGLAAVRLLSGVELTLQGPLDLTFESANGVEARLERGRLLVWVPPRANGLIIRTRELEAWDIGTVFSVSADATGSALLVFKGQVQVMESNGDAVGLCEAGEGAWAGANDRTVWKTSLDALKDRGAFTAMQGDAALKSPVAAMDLARRIQEAWVGAFTPQDSARMQERRKQLAAERAAAARVPFSKQAWVRPAAPAPQQEGNMKTKSASATLVAAALLMGTEAAGVTSPSVQIYATPPRGRIWETVRTNEVPLVWEWMPDAARARLEIAGMNGTAAVEFDERTTNWLWQAFAPQTAPAEDVYDLTLAFYGTGGEAIGGLTSRLAIVAGAFGAATVRAVTNAPEWSRVRENVVIPYDAGWAAATDGAPTGSLMIARAGGMAQTNALLSSSGYFGWKLRGSGWGYGTFNLFLNFPGTEEGWDAALTRVAEGLIFSVR